MADTLASPDVIKRLALCAVVTALAGCPVGCPKGDPQTVYPGPVEEVHLERTGRCTFRATPPLPRPFGPIDDGIYFVVLNDDVPLAKFLDYDPATATFTVIEPFCSQGVESLRITYRPWMRTVNE